MMYKYKGYTYKAQEYDKDIFKISLTSLKSRTFLYVFTGYYDSAENYEPMAFFKNKKELENDKELINPNENEKILIHLCEKNNDFFYEEETFKEFFKKEIEKLLLKEKEQEDGRRNIRIQERRFRPSIHIS